MKPPKRPRDPNQLAKMIVDLSTGQEPVFAPPPKVAEQVIRKKAVSLKKDALTSRPKHQVES